MEISEEELEIIMNEAHILSKSIAKLLKAYEENSKLKFGRKWLAELIALHLLRKAIIETPSNKKDQKMVEIFLNLIDKKLEDDLE